MGLIICFACRRPIGSGMPHILGCAATLRAPWSDNALARLLTAVAMRS